MMSKLPTFLNRNNDAPQPSVARDPVVDSAARGWDAISQLVEDRDAARRECEFQRQHVADLSARLTVAATDAETYRHRAEHFERFATEIITQFNTLRMIVDDIQKRATHIAYERKKPQPEPEEAPSELEAVENDRLDALMKQIREANGGPHGRQD